MCNFFLKLQAFSTALAAVLIGAVVNKVCISTDVTWPLWILAFVALAPLVAFGLAYALAEAADERYKTGVNRKRLITLRERRQTLVTARRRFHLSFGWAAGLGIGTLAFYLGMLWRNGAFQPFIDDLSSGAIDQTLAPVPLIMVGVTILVALRDDLKNFL